MKNASIIILLLSVVIQTICSQSLITIKQDGTGDYPTIQEGVDASNDGDTILVWPGIYYEHIHAFEKNFVLGSLNLTTGDPSYISQTIIDGMKSGRCVEIHYSSNGSTICGFTITNGYALAETTPEGGGALYLRYSDIFINNCIIDSNFASGYGGGIESNHSNTNVSGVTITNNHAYDRGGGICRVAGTLTFDSINLCNIYLNYSGKGTDIHKLGDEPMHVVLDTFTVQNPDSYYIFSDSSGYTVYDVTWDINTGKIQQSFQDLYVSPSGDNANDGYTPSNSLKTISYALLRMGSDTISPDSIHIANGYYAPSTGEKFPLSLKSNVSMIGSDRDSIFLDGEDEIYVLRGSMYTDNYLLMNMSIQHGNGNKSSVWRCGVFHIFENRNAMIANVVFRENTGKKNSSGVIMNSNGFKVVNSIFDNNVGGSALRTHHARLEIQYDTIDVINCQFINNHPDYSIPPEEGGNGGAFGSFGHEVVSNPKLFHTYFYNCLFAVNHSREHPYGGMSHIAMVFIRNAKGFVSNCTFGNNTSDNELGANIGVTYNAELSVYNSIMYQSDPAEFYMYTYDGNTYLNIYNSVVQGGEEEIRLYTPGNIVYYDPSNIDTDPMWDTTCMYPYSLSAGSPCIDAGTLELPPGIELPETDLAGNPRVHNGYVDMGAYEYGPWVGIDKYNSKLKTQNLKLLHVFPNPFRFETSISYTAPEKGNTIIRVYDLNGRCVKTLMNVHGQRGEGELRWRGTDDSGQQLKAGTYIISIIINGKERDAVKVVKQ